MAFCNTCTHIFNCAFAPDLFQYSHWFGRSIHHESRFCKEGRLIADRLVERYDMRHKVVVEVGAGCAEYAQLFADIGENRTAIVNLSQNGDQIDRGTLISPSSNSSDYMTFFDFNADLVCCQSGLAETDKPVRYLRNLRRFMSGDKAPVFYFEFIDSRQFFKKNTFWDIHYGQYSYFSPKSITYLLEHNGFNLIGMHPLDDDQGFSVEAIPVMHPIKPFVQNEGMSLAEAQKFAEHSTNLLDKLHNKLVENSQNRTATAMVWCDPRSIRLLNLIKLKDLIALVIDPRFEKQGMFIPGTGQRIRSLSAYFSVNPGTVILADPSIEADIRELFTGLRLSTDLMIL